MSRFHRLTKDNADSMLLGPRKGLCFVLRFIKMVREIPCLLVKLKCIFIIGIKPGIRHTHKCNRCQRYFKQRD